MRERVRIRNQEVLAEGWATLRKVTLDYRRSNGSWEKQVREVFDPGDGAVVLPFDPDRGTLLLVRQFRLPAFLNGDPEPLIEACAGKLDGDDPESCIRKEAEEELGYRLRALKPLFCAYSTPGAVTERLWYFTAAYSPADRVSAGGGAAGEGEELEVIEISLDEAFSAVLDGRIADAKTILLIQHVKLAVMGG